MLHGVVFVAFCVTTVVVAVDQRWSLGRTLLGLVSAVPPFATVLFDWYAERQVPTMTVATQARNIATLVVNERCGFIVHSVDLWYHKWYRFPESESL